MRLFVAEGKINGEGWNTACRKKISENMGIWRGGARVGHTNRKKERIIIIYFLIHIFIMFESSTVTQNMDIVQYVPLCPVCRAKRQDPAGSDFPSARARP